MVPSLASLMESDRHKIELNSADNTYLSGTTIHGTIQLPCTDKGKKIRSLSFRLLGRGKCKWTSLVLQPERSAAHQLLPAADGQLSLAFAGAEDSGSAGSGSSNTSSSLSVAVAPAAGGAEAAAAAGGEGAAGADAEGKAGFALLYRGKELYVDKLEYLVGSKNAPSFTIYPHNNTFSFSCPLHPQLPSTFTSRYGRIKYTLAIHVEIPWGFDERYTVPIIVRHALDLNAIPRNLLPCQRQHTRNVGFLSPKPASLHVCTPRGGCATGDRFPVQVIVQNCSNIYIDWLEFRLVQLVEHHSTSPARFMIAERLTVLSKRVGGVGKRSDRKYEHVLEIPDHLPATRTGRGILNIAYEIEVEARISWLRKLQQTIPFVIASMPFFAPPQLSASIAPGLDEPEGSAAPAPRSRAPAPPRPAEAPQVPAPAHVPTQVQPQPGWVMPSMSINISGGFMSQMMQSLPNVVMPHPYAPAPAPGTPQPAAADPPNYAQSTQSAYASPAPAFQRGSVGASSLRSERYAAASAPAPELATPTGSVQSVPLYPGGSSSSGGQRHSQPPSAGWQSSAILLPPSYDQVTSEGGGGEGGAAAAVAASAPWRSSSSSGASSGAATPVNKRQPTPARR